MESERITSRQALREWLSYEKEYYLRHSRKIYYYIKALRKYEYYSNLLSSGKKTALIGYAFNRVRYLFWGTLFGYEIPPNTCGKGLKIGHIGSVVINSTSIVGKNCTIIGNVCLGSVWGGKGPIIGDNVELGYGSIVVGNVKIGSNSFVGSGAVVTKDFPEEGVKLVGVPAHRL